MINDDQLRSMYRAEMDQIGFGTDQKQRIQRALVQQNTGLSNLQRRVVAVLASASVLLGGGVAVAAYQGTSPQDLAADMFGTSANTEIVDRIGRPIGASASSNGVRITADAIMGDAQNYAIVYSIAKEDGTAFENLPTPLEGGKLPLGFKRWDTRIPKETGAAGSAYFYDRDPSDNSIQLVEEMSVFGTGGLQGKTAKVTLKDLYVADGSGAGIANGTWHLNFDINYEDASIPGPTGQTFQLGGGEARITKHTISPLGSSIEYEADEPGLTDLPEASAVLIDGRRLPLRQGGTQCDTSQPHQKCTTSLKFPQVIEPKLVDRIEF